MSCLWARSDRLGGLRELYPDRGQIICIDTETTGLSPMDGDEVLQLAAADVPTGEVLYDRYLWPAHNREWPEAEAVNRISPETVRDAPSVCEERGRIQEMLDGASVIIGYNLGFDERFLEAAGFVLDPEWEIDVMYDWAAHVGDYQTWCGGYRWQKLSSAARRTGYTGHRRHDALGDVMATIHVAKWLQEHPERMNANYLTCDDWELQAQERDEAGDDA